MTCFNHCRISYDVMAIRNDPQGTFHCNVHRLISVSGRIVLNASFRLNLNWKSVVPYLGFIYALQYDSTLLKMNKIIVEVHYRTVSDLKYVLKNGIDLHEHGCNFSL